MRFVVVYTVLVLIIALRGIWPAVKARKARLWLLVCVIPGGLFPYVTRFIGGSMVAPELPTVVMVVGDFLQNFTLILAVLVILREMCSFFLRILGLPLNVLAQSRYVWTVLLAASLGLNIYGEHHALYALKTVHVDVEMPGLPAKMDGLRVAVISDLHVSDLFKTDRIRTVVSRVNALNVDIVVVTGDIVDGTVERRAEDVRPLSELRAKYGVFGVEGNHEHYIDYDGWRGFLPTLGMRMLFNEHELVQTPGGELVVAGLTDNRAGHFDREMPDLNKALAGAPDGKPVLLLVHQPRSAANYADRVGLMISGHTHGGQVGLLYPVVSKLNNGFVSGLYDVKGSGGGVMKLYVTPGTDVWNGFALRIGTTGEVTLLQLRSPELNKAKE